MFRDFQNMIKGLNIDIKGKKYGKDWGQEKINVWDRNWSLDPELW